MDEETGALLFEPMEDFLKRTDWKVGNVKTGRRLVEESNGFALVVGFVKFRKVLV